MPPDQGAAPPRRIDMRAVRFVTIAGVSVIAFAWMSTRPAPAAQQPSAAELVLTNGKIVTVDGRDSVAQAVAIAAGRIVAVGTNDEVRSRVGPSTRVIDLRGRTATPGLIDTHVHFTEVDTLFSVNLGVVEVRTVDDALQRVAAAVAKHKPGEWIRGSGWDEGKLAERRYLLASDLDKVAPNNPVWLEHTTGHYGVANSYALKMAEIRKDTKDPPAGTIDRDAQGNPTGGMKEAAQGMVTRLVPGYQRRQAERGHGRRGQDLNRARM